MKFPSAEKRPLPDSGREKMASRSLESSMARLLAIMYIYLAKAMIDRFKERGRIELEKALNAFAVHRAVKLRSDHEIAGLNLNLATLLKNGDVSYGDSLEMGCDYKANNRTTITITKNVFYEAFKEIEGRQTPIEHLYFQTVLCRLLSTYLETANVEMTACQALNDPQTVLEVRC